MSKRVLFVIKDMNHGGSATSLLNMLYMLKDKGYEADLYLMQHRGIFLKEAKEAAHVVPESFRLSASLCEGSAVKQRFGLKGIIYRAYLSFLKRVRSQDRVQESIFQRVGKGIKGYDAVVSYQENITTDFAKYIPAAKKVAWVHTVYDRFTVNLSPEAVYQTYARFDRIVCVANAPAKAFCNGQPRLSDRVTVLNNPMNVQQILEKAKGDYPTKDGFKLVSVGRLSPEKRYERCLEAAAMLQREGYAFHWYLVGSGVEQAKLEKLRLELGVKDSVTMTGALENPYPLLRQADLLVISSEYEAQPMVANEALILDVPVITTDYDSAHEVVSHGINGIICKKNAESLGNAIRALLNDPMAWETLKQGARAFQYDNERILRTAIDLIYGETV